ncbi:MAG: class I SAM-dependent methyltransferase [Actinomycetota bacterium]
MSAVGRLLARVGRIGPVARGRVLLARGTEPASRAHGGDRGTPVHRWYIAGFVGDHADLIRGRVLEFQDPAYARRFGGERTDRIDVLNREPNAHATIVADLCGPNEVPSDGFDCIICIHTLHVVLDDTTFMRELFRILAPGGTLLVAVPATSAVDPGWDEYRRYTTLGLRRLLETVFAPEAVSVTSLGNSLTAAAEMRGLAADELTSRDLSPNDPQFPVTVCAVSTKPVE